jgi:hypothetical protein
VLETADEYGQRNTTRPQQDKQIIFSTLTSGNARQLKKLSGIAALYRLQ